MEKLMQFVWQHRLGLQHDMFTSDGVKIRVVNQGLLNSDAGPDFFNATVEIGDETWVGNVEIHVKASDWHRHGHDADKAYDSVILHVVKEDDCRICRTDGSLIPQVVMNCSAEGAERCNSLLDSAVSALPCAKTVSTLPEIYVTDWLTALGVERLINKSNRVKELVDSSNGHWEGAAYVTLARGLGFGLNGEPFERLARGLPLAFLNRHHDELMTVEALLFGRAGLIPPRQPDEDEYVTHIRREYEYFAHKFELGTATDLAWKMARTRPQNFPHRRIAVLAAMIHRGFKLMGAIEDAKSVDDLRGLFKARLLGFWSNHFSFDSWCSRAMAFGDDSVERLVINVAIPLLHARSMAKGDADGMERCIEWLEQIKGEKNRVVQVFESAGIECGNAFRSQALIELRREYCEKKKCIYCRFGHRMLSAEIAK